MASILKVDKIRGTGLDSDTISLDGTGNITIPKNVTFSGTVTGATGMTLTNSGGVDVDGSAEALFTGLPAGIKRIQVNLYRCSASGSDTGALIRLGTSSGIVTSGYSSLSHWGGGGQSDTSGFYLYGTAGGNAINGIATINNMGSDRFISSHSLMYNGSNGAFGGGYKDLGGTLTQLRVSLVSGGNFDFGRINIMYEI
tara:strand:- start:57 stop:650 length:594 start_codon:yes stop_codon:yes gene_type:complete